LTVGTAILLIEAQQGIQHHNNQNRHRTIGIAKRNRAMTDAMIRVT